MMDFVLFVLLIVVLLLQVYSILPHEFAIKRKEKKLDAKAQEAMDAETKRSVAMDEGFENIMRFSVNGHDGFGGGI